ncbi:MAG: hypothetical protein RLZ72_1223 [Actinomycetota bacterium]|jgi:Amt family ammonium transporter
MDSGQLTWAIVATAMVLFMTPGLAFFYGGLVKAKSVISMMMMSVGTMALVGVLWVLVGRSMSVVASPEDFSGNPFSDFLAVNDTNESMLASLFAASFAIITVALISGAVADRAKFGAWMLFAGVFAVVAYFPISAWVWGGGWIAALGDNMGLPPVIDYAGGLAVEITSGSAALALALVLGKRVNFGRGIHQPHNVPLTLIGFGILFFGWFGFNAGGEAFTDMAKVGLISMNTFVAGAAASLGWMMVERVKDGKATSVGAASGAVAGLVAITPSCANLTPSLAILLGLIAGVACAYAIELKFALGFDDSLDVVGIHLVGGIVGMLFLGFFATETGFFFSGNIGQLVVQLIAVVAVMLFSFLAALLIGSVIERTMGFRASTEAELAGIDTVVHGELGYALDED